MVKRKRIGLFFESYSTLPAFVIYIQNIIRTLNLADDRDKPELVILHLPDSPLHEVKEINYPYISFYQLANIYKSPAKRILNKVWRTFFNKNAVPFFDKNFPTDLDCIFPYYMHPETEYVKHKIVWKPDFQEYHLPIYFTVNELKWSKEYMDSVSLNPWHLVLSSEDSKRDFIHAYPKNSNPVHLWKFTSFLPDTKNIDAAKLLDKFKATGKYFLVANQFWPHKNHLNVLKALKICAEKNCDFKIVFTGKQKSARDPELFEKLQTYISLHGLDERVVFTGFMPREEQIVLMERSMAVIQPSLFEGWSTVIEDCKALNQFVIASDLSVNREQIKQNVVFFDPYNYKDLADKLLDFSKKGLPKVSFDYSQEILRFKNDILNTFYPA
jgi:glycosyltransferase involved in cell wall biosynthesis